MSGRFGVIYDEEKDWWLVYEIKTGRYYPMVDEKVANDVALLLNKYDNRVHNVLDELYKKDRKFESLGFDLIELDKELDIKGF